MKRLKLILCIHSFIVSTFVGQVLHAQPKRAWVLSHILNADNGLPQNSVIRFHFDHNSGFLWIATEGGMVSYNGISTKLFDTRNMPIKIARMAGFLPTISREVLAMDKAGVSVQLKGNRPDTQRHDLNWNPSYAGFQYYKLPAPDVIDTTLKYNYALAKTGRKDIGSQTKAMLFMDDSTTVIIVPDSIYLVRKDVVRMPNPLPFPFSNQNVVKVLLVNGNDIALLNTQCNGVYIDVLERKICPIKLTTKLALDDHRIIYPDNINQLHCLLNGKNIYEVNVSKKGVEASLLADLPSLPDYINYVAIHPQKKQVYIGTSFTGVYIYNHSNFYTYLCDGAKSFQVPREPDLFPSAVNFYTSTLVDSSHILVSFSERGVYPSVLINLENGSFILPKIIMGELHMDIDKERNIYVNNDGLRKYPFSPYTGKFLPYNFQLKTLFYDSKFDRLTILLNDRTLSYIENDLPRPWIHLPETQVSKINFLKRTGNVLIAFGPSIVYVMDEQHKKLHPVFSLDGDFVRDVSVDQDSLAWITTYGKGIYMYDIRKKKIYRPKTDAKQYLLFAHYLADDKHGNYFIPTNNGLFHINRKALIAACLDSTSTVFYHYYDKTNGLLQNEFNGGCYPGGNIMSNGDWLFPSVKGLVRAFTSSITSPNQYPLFIQSVASSSKTYEFADSMTFTSGERTLTWEVNFAQWESPTTSGLSYRLDNGGWNFVPAGERKILVTDLNGGSHTLQLRNQYDLEGTKISRLTVHFFIKKRYYEQSWFWILVSFGLLGLIYLAVSMRNYQLKRQNVLLEKKIHKQTLEVRNKNTELEETLHNLNAAMDHLQKNSHFQQRLIGLLGHDIMVPLRYISQVSKQLITYRTKLSEETVLGAIGEIDNTSIQLLFLGESIIHWIKLQEGDFIPQYSYFNVHQLARELLTLHQPIAADKKNVIKNEVPENLYCVQESTILRIIIHNLLLNANKFTANGEIIIAASKTNNIVDLIVQDSGVGMDELQIANLNGMTPVTSQKGTNNEQGWGLGYRFIIDLVKFVKGKINIQSKKGAGTKVTIELISRDLNEADAI